jgi:hypothetical protein
MPVAIKLTLQLVVHALFLCSTDTAPPDIYEHNIELFEFEFEFIYILQILSRLVP